MFMFPSTASILIAAALMSVYADNVSVVTARAQCVVDVDCSLNGLCTDSLCVCDAPWSGPSCSSLAFAVTPAIAQNIYNNSADTRNTWGGAIAGPDDRLKYHFYMPLYKAGSFDFPVDATWHGIADAPTGPWDFQTMDSLDNWDSNPHFLAYPSGGGNGSGAATVTTVYSLWFDGNLMTSDSLDGPFLHIDGGLGINPSPIFHNNAFYFVPNSVDMIMTAPTVVGPWIVYSNITQPGFMLAIPEDPFMWIDKRKNWHIISHAYNPDDNKTDCGNSHASSHFFSEDDGMTWSYSAQPYGHTVTYDDGTTHTFATLERPSLLFNAKGQPAFLTTAVDLQADEACPSTADPHWNCCTCCKYKDHLGTTVIALAV